MAMTMMRVIQASAVAGDGSGYPAGGRHALLAFVVDPDRDLAYERLAETLTGNGWTALDVIRSGTIPSDLETVADPRLRAAATTALDRGCAFIIYDEPLGSSARP